ncbi:prenyltransferase [Colwellia ponticola]|nr:prenyltransferase [Colwellia ponticola]
MTRLTINTVLKTLLKTMRPAFLVLTLACVFLGFCTAFATGVSIDSLLFILVLVGALCAHISVNMLNEYHDFHSGLDFKTQRTPFSGGSGALPSHPRIATIVLWFGLLTLLMTTAIGIYFIINMGSVIGTTILPIGMVGLIIIITYTKWLNRMPLLCLFAPGVGFGLLMVVGTHIVLTSAYSSLVWLVSLIPFLLINNLLLLNQYPDMQADASVGRKTFPLVFGVKRSNIVYAIFMIAAYALIGLYVLVAVLPVISLIALVPLPLSIFALTGVIKHQANIGNFPQHLAANVAATIITPFLLGLSILIS